MPEFDVILKWYLISCIPAIFWIAVTAWEDIQCHRGLKKPDHKFGLNWVWGRFNMAQYITLGCFIPLLNLYVGWFIVMGVVISGIYEAVKTSFEKQRVKDGSKK